MFEAFESIVASRVEFERFSHEWRAPLVDLSRIDQAAFVLDANVEVSERCFAGGTAVGCLVLQLDSNILTAQSVLDIIEDVSDGFHGIGVDTIAEILSGGDEPDIQLVQDTLGDRPARDLAT